MKVWLRIVTAVVLAAALSVTSWVGESFFIGACVLVVLCAAAGWPSLVENRHRRATSVLIAVIGLLGIVSVWFAAQPTLLWLSVLAALGILATFVMQLILGPNERGLTILLSSQATGIVIVLASCAWLAQPPGRSAVVIAGAVALVFALAVTMVPWPAVYTSPLAVLVGAAAAAAVTEIAGAGSPASLWVGIVLGGVLGVLVAAVHRLLGMGRPVKRSKRAHSASTNVHVVELGLGTVPIALGGALVYITERLFIA